LGGAEVVGDRSENRRTECHNVEMIEPLKLLSGFIDDCHTT
jgi:hypothetical protein